MKRLLCGVIFCLCLVGTGSARAGDTGSVEAVVGQHMVAQALLTAHFVAAALKAGMDAGEINEVLSEVADQTVIGEFWISDESGRIAYSSAPAQGFAFPTDPESDAQAAPFARLLTGEAAVVEQEIRPRDLDGAQFKYVGVAGVDAQRIIQVGMPASAFE